MVRFKPVARLGHELGQRGPMARQSHLLNALRVKTLMAHGAPKRHPDGGGLYLSISKNGGQRWVFLYRRNKRLREKGLGSARIVSLADARVLATEARQQLAQGIDPLGSRAARLVPTFQVAAKEYIEQNKKGWKNAKHAEQWTSTLDRYADPIIGSLPVSEIDTSHIVEILKPMWSTKTETASRVRGRVEAVLDWARAHGLRDGDNPARWRGHLSKLFPARSRVSPVEHHPALPYEEMPEFVRELRSRSALTASALEFAILTAARTGETVQATWGEINFDQQVWIVPKEHMKSGTEHRVPLCARAIDILRSVQPNKIDAEAHIFPGGRRGKPLSENGMLALLARMGRKDITVHGFRSTFRDWAGECTNAPNEVVEMALAHVIENKAEAAYRRGDLFNKRRALMLMWGKYCNGLQADTVVSLNDAMREMSLLGAAVGIEVATS
ncbi:MAG: integrase arm-type DNA-binding domain-containing protein [Xanthobacteraceae bacterium]